MIQNKSLARQQRITKLISSTSGPKSRPWLLLLAFAHVIRDLSLFFIFFSWSYTSTTPYPRSLHLKDFDHLDIDILQLHFSRRRNILTNEKKEKKERKNLPTISTIISSFELERIIFSRENFYEKQIINARNLLN